MNEYQRQWLVEAAPAAQDEIERLRAENAKLRAPVPASGPHCAHLRVNWTTEDDHHGVTHGWWECADCGARFVPLAAAREDSNRLAKALRELSQVSARVINEGDSRWIVALPVPLNNAAAALAAHQEER